MEKSLEEKVRDRKAEAMELRISEKIVKIGKEFGVYSNCFNYTHYFYSCNGITFSARRYYGAKEGGCEAIVYFHGQEVFNETGTDVTRYIPGKWIDEIESWYQEAHKISSFFRPERRFRNGVSTKEYNRMLRKRFGL